MKKVVKEFLAIFLLIFNFIAFKKTDPVLSVYFHDPSSKLFERIIRYLAQRSYRFVSLEEFSEIIENGRNTDKIAIITIDDGWCKNMDLVNVINKYGVYTTIFITTQAVESGNFWFEFILNEKSGHSKKRKKIIETKGLDSDNYYSEIERLQKRLKIPRSALNIEELKIISRNPHVSIGSHTVTHICLPGKDKVVQMKELSDSKKKLEEWINKEVNYFSYPGGDYTEEQKVIALNCGYKLCFTTETKGIDITNIDRLSIPRRCINDDAGYFESLTKVHGLWPQL